jgi:hypothetical protein
MTLDSGYSIRGARRREAAARGQQGRDQHLIRPDDPDDDSLRRIHADNPAFLSTTRIARSIASGSAVARPFLATSATSQPRHGPPARRAASRRTRRHLLRRTALPSFLPAMNATRPSGPRPAGVSVTSASNSGCPARLPSANIRSISCEEVTVSTPLPLSKRRAARKRSGAENRTALTAASSQDSAATTRGHALTEPVSLLASAIVRLESTLHSEGPPIGATWSVLRTARRL